MKNLALWTILLTICGCVPQTPMQRLNSECQGGDEIACSALAANGDYWMRNGLNQPARPNNQAALGALLLMQQSRPVTLPAYQMPPISQSVNTTCSQIGDFLNCNTQ